jgi:hypothetical protein
MLRQLDPEGVKRRTHDLQRRRGEYHAYGPNYLWCLDGHDKLEPWGFRIYACIDAYSRYIIWIYIGICNKSTISTLLQYLIGIERAGNQMPQNLRVDHGTETTLVGEAHYGLARTWMSNILFNEVFFYGPSTQNIRIETWWGQLGKSSLYRWRVSISFIIILKSRHFLIRISRAISRN